jgi:exodeoxyribonuclease-3
MREIKILCWNVNGIRAAAAKGLLEWLHRENPDILCLQETKAQPDQLSEAIRDPGGYHAYWNYPVQKGYSGVATLSREKPLRVQTGLGMPQFDSEGRTIIAEFPGFTVMNIYFPNGKKDGQRLQYKMDFYEAFLKFTEPLRAQGKKMVICGDFNTAHKEIDLARPKENEKVSGFLPMERAWMDRFVSCGYADTFRQFNREPGQYTWWDLKSRARERNVGWRIDYFFVTENLLPSVSSAFIMPEVTGSDHCPIGIMLSMPA